MLPIRRMFCPDTGRYERVAVPPEPRKPDALRDPMAAFYREQDMLDEMLGKNRR